MGFFDFFRRWQASSDDRSVWGDFWFEPVTVRTSSSMRVSADNALNAAKHRMVVPMRAAKILMWKEDQPEPRF